MSTSNRGEWLHGRSTHFYFGTQWGVNRAGRPVE